MCWRLSDNWPKPYHELVPQPLAEQPSPAGLRRGRPGLEALAVGMSRSALDLVQQLLVSDSFFDRPPTCHSGVGGLG